MWHLEAIVLPVVVWAFVVIKKTTEDHIARIPGSPCLQELQKVVLKGKAHLQRRVLSIWRSILSSHNQKINIILGLQS